MFQKIKKMSNTDFCDVTRAAELLEDYDRSWAICGGWAIDLYLGRVTRPHKDVDFFIPRRDQLVVQEYLSSRGWTLEKAIKGQLIPWQTGEWINLPIHTIWCKNPKATPDFVELLFDEVDHLNFQFRRDVSITLPVEKTIIMSESGVAILAPEIVMLYKSNNAEEPAYAADFKNILPKLSSEGRHWFAAALKKLDADHVWLGYLH